MSANNPTISIPSAPNYHAVARCRWCQGRFVKTYGWQWRCENDACYDRCVKYAILHREPPQNNSPFFYLPLPLQVEIEESPFKRTLVWGAAGISKSFGARMSLYRQCQAIPGSQILLLRCTLDQLKKNHLRFMEREQHILGDCKFVGSYPIHMKFDNGSNMFAGYCEDDADISQHLGPEWDRILLEEAGFFLPRALSEISARDRGSKDAREANPHLNLTTGRTTNLTNPGGRGWMMLREFYIDKNPDPEEFPQYQFAKEQYGNLTGSVEDNPYLDENYRRDTLGHLNAQRYEQLAHGNADAFEGQFFTDWNEAQHVVELPR